MLIGVPFFHRALQKLVLCRLNHPLKTAKARPHERGQALCPTF